MKRGKDMSRLFEKSTIKGMELRNRFVRSATDEAMAGPNGVITDQLIKLYSNLAKGGIGLIISGHFYVHTSGQISGKQKGIHTDELIPGLRRLVDAVHEHGAKIAFQLSHGGVQADSRHTGRSLLAPSGKARNPYSFEKPKEMNEEEITEIIQAFVQAGRRAVEAGADAIQLHGAHGYLISEFLSPFFNRRQDAWGGSDENRFQFVKEVIQETKRVLPGEMPVLVKLNTNDFTPKLGVNPDLAGKYVRWLTDLGVDGVELSCGTYSSFHTIRGGIPIKEFAGMMPGWIRPIVKFQLKRMGSRCAYEEGYNLDAAKMIGAERRDVRLFLVGGMRRVAHMEDVLEQGYADYISMSRPFIREPLLVKRFMEGKQDEATCISCNNCMAALIKGLPLRCYVDGLPE
jgi:2,4-dienoyl-CoA reductase-like NADH-dependent reductase (Old Yellow Enzyme family)